ncbi:MAG: class I SAM-dependent methyltransferase [Planctomycetota bacterium]|jgi:2-polyprenyl-3-methyl-5-hydroxy-6-metoxy-1,4-benzoquinol methylase
MQLPTSWPAYSENEQKVVNWLSELTQQSPASVRSRLQQERDNLGINVASDLRKNGIEPYKWSDELADFYSGTDAFLYELIIWNLNRCKRRMRQWIGRYLDRNVGNKLNVLTIGDGLGVDSIYLAKAGHCVTYFEISGYAQSFAKKLFKDCGLDINVIDDMHKIPAESYDVVLCLDVLEHVPDPPAFVKTMTRYLKPDGHLIVHAPFYQIRSNTPTHLKINRKYSGSLRLYEKHGLRLVGGELTWTPIVLKKICGKQKDISWRKPELLALRLAGLYLALGRFTVLPFLWINSYVAGRCEWFRR